MKLNHNLKNMEETLKIIEAFEKIPEKQKKLFWDMNVVIAEIHKNNRLLNDLLEKQKKIIKS